MDSRNQRRKDSGLWRELGLLKIARMSTRIKVSLAILVLTTALPMRTFGLTLIVREPDHNCTVRVAGRTFGFTGYSAGIPGSAVTYVSYGWGYWQMRLPFYGVVGGTVALIAVLGLAGGALILRRRHENVA